MHHLASRRPRRVTRCKVRALEACGPTCCWCMLHSPSMRTRASQQNLFPFTCRLDARTREAYVRPKTATTTTTTTRSHVTHVRRLHKETFFDKRYLSSSCDTYRYIRSVCGRRERKKKIERKKQHTAFIYLYHTYTKEELHVCLFTLPACVCCSYVLCASYVFSPLLSFVLFVFSFQVCLPACPVEPI